MRQHCCRNRKEQVDKIHKEVSFLFFKDFILQDILHLMKIIVIKMYLEVKAMSLPLMATIRQKFPKERITDIEASVQSQLQSINLNSRIRAGQTIGITAGSRGITNIVNILREIVKTVKDAGARPVLIPAMGSHGGGTPEGQLAILHKLGITEESMGTTIIPETEGILLGYTNEGTPVYINRAALNCDGIIVVNRVKPHTSFHGPVESGIHKMIAVGLGGPAGAEAIHRAGAPALSKIIPEIAKEIMKRVPIIMGMAIIENAYEETQLIASVLPEELWEKETLLLEKARQAMPSLPINEIDLLIVDQMGKNFSGTGMDTNIIGRLRIQGMPEPESPKIKRIAVLDLSPESNGNANGIGLADFTTRRLVDKIDFKNTYKNTLTATFTQRAMIPITLKNDREVISIALQSIGHLDFQKAKIIRIKNTLNLTEIQVSSSVLDEILANPRVQLIKKPAEMEFDSSGNLLPF